LAAFLLFLGVGWMALSYLRIEMLNRRTVNLAPSAAALTQLKSKEKRPLVYSVPGDKVHYHASTHLPPNSDRRALSEEAALSRGLKPCPICFKK
jgi:hypothetical protein